MERSRGRLSHQNAATEREKRDTGRERKGKSCNLTRNGFTVKEIAARLSCRVLAKLIERHSPRHNLLLFQENSSRRAEGHVAAPKLTNTTVGATATLPVTATSRHQPQGQHEAQQVAHRALRATNCQLLLCLTRGKQRATCQLHGFS